MNHPFKSTTPEDDQYIVLLTLILERQDAILDKQSAQEHELSKHMACEEGMTKELVDAFPLKPDGTPDTTGHRAYHDAIIDESRSRAQMWRDLRNELVKKGAWGIIIVLGSLIAYWWNHEVKR